MLSKINRPLRPWAFSFVFLFIFGILFSINHILLSEANDKEISSVEVGFTSLSPNGTDGGEIIPASCESGWNVGEGGVAHYPGDTSGTCTSSCQFNRENGMCYASNACGQRAAGANCTFRGCMAVPPPLPTGYGTVCSSAPNACGMTNSGTVQCDGSCSATRPSDTLCPTPVSGVCAATHYNCSAGTSTNNVDGAAAWTWTCAGSNGGSSASCSEAKPVTPPATPTNYTVSCNAAGDQATQSWDAVPGAIDYYVRMNLLSNDSPTCTGGWLCATPPDYADNNFVGTSITHSVIPGQAYGSWVHSRNAGGTSAATSYPFTCSASTLKVCQDSCSSGIQISNGSTISMQDTDSSRNIVACYSTASGCNDASANITSSATWTESGQDAITLSGSNPKVLSPNTLAGPGTQTERVTTTYSGSSVSFDAVVTKFCASGCTPAQDATVCSGQTYTAVSPSPGCGSVTNTCTGTRLCDFNWKEVAP